MDDISIKKTHYYFGTTREKYRRRSKAIFKIADYYKDRKFWLKIAERNKSSR